MPENKNANQEQEPTNEGNEEKKTDESQEEPKEHYENLVDDAILGSMNGGEESS